MMQHVSLLPPEIKKKRQEREKLGKIQTMIFIVLLLLVAVNAFYLVNIFMVRSNLKTLRSEREFTEQQAAALTEFADLHNEIMASERLIESAMGTVPQWSSFFRELSQILPLTAWFSDLHVVYRDQAQNLSIRGWSYDHDSLADLLVSLEKFEQLDRIRVRVSTETSYQNRDAVTFQVDAALLSGPGYFNENGGEE
jgi:Tfp pilus assembly protein PilN